MISANGLSVAYGAHSIFKSLSFDIGHGITGLLGPNGAGKTTLLECLATVRRADAGETRVAGIDPSANANALRQSRRKLGFLPQNPSFINRFSVRTMLRYLAVLKEISDRQVAAEVERVLDAVDLTPYGDKRIKELSGGMRQRVGIAQAILGTPSVVILDEPTVGLDPEQRNEFKSVISALGESATVLLSTHQTEDVAALCEMVYVLARGDFQFMGSPQELAAQAAGRVWITEKRPAEGEFWRTPDGRFRSTGAKPEGGEPIDPMVEDGYLMLLGQKDEAN